MTKNRQETTIEDLQDSLKNLYDIVLEQNKVIKTILDILKEGDPRKHE